MPLYGMALLGSGLARSDGLAEGRKSMFTNKCKACDLERIPRDEGALPRCPSCGSVVSRDQVILMKRSTQDTFTAKVTRCEHGADERGRSGWWLSLEPSRRSDSGQFVWSVVHIAECEVEMLEVIGEEAELIRLGILDTKAKTNGGDQ